MGIKAVAAVICALAMVTPSLALDFNSEWEDFRDDIAFGDGDLDWQHLASDYPMDIGTVQNAYWVLAWRQGSEAGVMLRYEYTVPVSPAELPRPGPMKYEEVEITLHCTDRTMRMHDMLLYRPDNSYIGKWFDPAAEQTPARFGDSGIIGMAFAKVC